MQTVAPEIMPIHEFYNIDERWALLGGTLMSTTSTVAAGGAGNRSQAAIEPGADELLIVDQISYSAVATVGIQWGLSTTALTGAANLLGAEDVRRMAAQATAAAQSGARVRIQNNAPIAALISTLGQKRVIINETQLLLTHPIILVQPWSLRVTPTTDNAALDVVTWYARSRPGIPRELNLVNL